MHVATSLWVCVCAIPTISPGAAEHHVDQRSVQQCTELTTLGAQCSYSADVHCLMFRTQICMDTCITRGHTRAVSPRQTIRGRAHLLWSLRTPPQLRYTKLLMGCRSMQANPPCTLPPTRTAGEDSSSAHSLTKTHSRRQGQWRRRVGQVVRDLALRCSLPSPAGHPSCWRHGEG